MWLSKVEESTGETIKIDWQPFSLAQVNSDNNDGGIKLWEQPEVIDGSDKTFLAHMSGLAAKRQGEEAFQGFFMALLRAREATMRWFRPHLATHGLTEQRWRVLRVLTSTDGLLDVGQVAERTFLLAPSLSRILADLESLGLVHRVADTVDRRRTPLIDR